MFHGLQQFQSCNLSGWLWCKARLLNDWQISWTFYINLIICFQLEYGSYGHEDCPIQRELFVVFKKIVNSFSYFIEVMQREPLNLPTDHSCENREKGNGWLRENKKNCMGSTMSEKSHWYNLLRWVSGFTAAEIHHMYVWISSELAHRKFGVGMFQIRHKWRFKLIPNCFWFGVMDIKGSHFWPKGACELTEWGL